MLAAQFSGAGSGPAFALSLAVVAAVVYLALLRLIDLNEKEPLWALGLMLLLGAIAAAVLSVLVHARTLHGTDVLSSVADELAIFAAISAGIGVLEVVGKLRGWSEINGVVDGAAYGAAAGLGFATGEAFIRELHTSGVFGAAVESSPLEVLWPTLLGGLAAGLFGSITGAAFGAALAGPRGPRQLVIALVGLGVAFGVQVAYQAVVHDNALSGSDAKLREWIGLGVPGLFFLILIGTGLRAERRAIADQLGHDPYAATPEELKLLTNPAARRAAYLRRLAALDPEGWLALRSLQNRQVQLALTRRRAAWAADPVRHSELEAEVERLRGAVVAARLHLRRGLPTPRPVTQGEL
jgi:RsiW-degrading membrane proteinase PrsW (M82 family)